MFSKLQTTNSGALDKAGVIASFICAVHCAAVPIAVSLFPLLGLTFLVDEQTDWILIGFSILIGVTSLIPSYIRHHRNKKTLVLFTVGVLLVLSSHIHFETSKFHLPMIIFGAIFVIFAHLINRKLCRICHVCQTDNNTDESCM